MRAISGATDAPDPETTARRLRYDVCWRREDGGVVLYDPRWDVVFHGNDTALSVIEMCNGKSTMGEIAAQLAARYGVPHDRTVRHVREFIGELDRLELLAKEH